MKKTKNFPTKNIFVFLLISVLLVTCDQLSKALAIKFLSSLNTNSFEIIPQVLRFELLFNEGASFGIMKDQRLFLILVNLIACILAVFLITHKDQINNNTYWFFGLCFLFSGSLGNLIDRILFGKVTDFINLLILPGDFPIFNVADILINIAVLLLLLSQVKRSS